MTSISMESKPSSCALGAAEHHFRRSLSTRLSGGRVKYLYTEPLSVWMPAQGRVTPPSEIRAP